MDRKGRPITYEGYCKDVFQAWLCRGRDRVGIYPKRLSVVVLDAYTSIHQPGGWRCPIRSAS
jgi:hypothetical protein